MFALLPAPAQAQGDFIKDTLKDLIEKSGVYVSIGTRQSIDNDVEMGPSLGIGYATLSLNPRTGKKYPFSFSTYSGDLRTSDTRQTFGRFGAKQIMTGIGYQWVRGRMIYSTQFGVGYSFNNVDIESAASNVFNAPQGPVSVDVSNSWVLRPQLKAEYILHPKVSVRSQLSYTYTDPNVIVQTATSRHEHEWRPHQVKFDIGVGVFPFRK
jgi:hypothetical protein